MEKIFKQKKGITLIALVITIIVLLILAGISISMISGDNNLLSRAGQARDNSIAGQEKEIVALAYNSALSKKIGNGDSTPVTSEDMNIELTNQGAIANGSNPIKVTFTETKRQYTVYTNGEIKYAGVKENNNNLILSVTSEETESRAIILKISAEGGDISNLSIDELSQYYVDGIKQQGAPYSTWSEFADDYKQHSGQECNNIEEYYEACGARDSGQYTDVYDFVNQNIPQLIQFSYNGETITGENAEFAITRPGSHKITATNSNGDYGEIIWSEYPTSKSEEYSAIQNSNYKLSKDGYDVWIPAGFSYGISENVGTVTTGLVITDSVEQVDGKNYSNGNEFVWIPVDKSNLTVGKTNKKMAEIASGANYRGKLYVWSNDQTGNTCYDPSLGRKEPAYLTFSDGNNSNTTGISEEILQQEYNNLIESINQYGGFYVARYEMGNSSSNISKINVIPDSNLNWWNGYTKAKAYNKSGVTSGMIWGSQWDAILNFGLTNSNDSAKVTANTNGNHSYTVKKTGIWLGTNNQLDKINNIFDLEGNVREWTMTAAIDGSGSSWSTSRRVIRGGSSRYTGSGGATESGCYNPGDVEDSYLCYDYFCTRIMLFLNV